MYSYIGIFINYFYLVAFIAILFLDKLIKLLCIKDNDDKPDSGNYTELKLSNIPQSEGYDE